MKVQCTACRSMVPLEHALKRPFGQFCRRECLMDHLRSPNPRTAGNEEKDRQAIENAALHIREKHKQIRVRRVRR